MKPERVSLTLKDGRKIPVDTKYAGMEDGNELWQVVAEVNLDNLHIESVEVRVLPAHTTVGFPVRLNDDILRYGKLINGSEYTMGIDAATENWT